MITKLADDKDNLELHSESISIVKKDLQSRISELEEALEQMEDKLQVATDAEGQWEGHLETLQNENAKDIERLTSISIQTKKENDDLKKQVIIYIF